MHEGTMQITMLDFFGLQNLNKTGVMDCLFHTYKQCIFITCTLMLL